MNRVSLSIFGAALALAPAAAHAHPGHDGSGGFVAGLVHPLTGIDHLAAMLLAGAIATFAMRGAAWKLPAMFLAAMLAGFGWGAWAGAGMAEPLIVLSLVTLGGAAALRLRTPAPLAAGVIAVFGFAHGQAHGIELPAEAIPALFAAGFLAASAALQGLGLWLARILPQPVLRIAGGAGAVLGIALAGAG